MRPLHPSAVPAWMIERATRRRLAGDWRGACEAAGVDADVDLRAIRRVHGADVADEVEGDLRHLVPDLLRWHLPRGRPDGLLRGGVWFPLALFPDGHALVARPPVWHDRPQRISLRFHRMAADEQCGARDDTLMLLRDRWDARCTAELLARSGGATRLPFFAPDGRRLPDDEVAGDGPEGQVELAVEVDGQGRHADAWAAAGWDLEVLLFQPAWGPDRIDPAAFDRARTDARDTVVNRSLAGLRPVHPWLVEAARRTLARVPALRLVEPWPSEPPRALPWPTEVDERPGLVRIDLRGRCLVLDRLDAPRPRARLVSRLPHGETDEDRERAEVAAFGLELARLPRMPFVLARRPAELSALLRGDLRPDDLHPLVRAALFPERPPLPPAATGPLRDTVRVRCAGATHEVVIRDGTFALPHPQAEIDRERMVKALGGQVQGCVAARDGWREHTVRMPRAMRRLRDELLARVWHGDGPAVAAALDGGIDPHVRDERGRTLLHLLPWLSGADLLPRLLAAGLRVDARDVDDETPLHAAVAHGSPDLVRALLAARADPKAMSTGRHGRIAAWTQRPDLDFLRPSRR
ncbi:ankyrin repeat domain-containing protein [Dactylosporangium sp. NPDC051485]|uniref:ankyrin repeat domain-containing protein n=1 Tax=Dactylosporangium sp. NPDC051485 TaxID=3154846 RepID=UPI0034397D99